MARHVAIQAQRQDRRRRGERRAPTAEDDFDGSDRGAARRDRAADRGEPRRSATARPSGGCCALRHLAGIRAARRRGGRPRAPGARLSTRLPEADALPGDRRRATLTPELLRAGILRDGCLLVRGLVAARRGAARSPSRSTAPSPSASARRRRRRGRGLLRGVRARTRASAPIAERPWIKEGGGVLAADSPMLTLRDARAVRRRRRCRALVDGYLGEPAADLGAEDDAAQGRARRSPAPGTRTARSWARSARSTCGSRCRAAATSRPGLDIVPRRLDEFVATRHRRGGALATRCRSARPRRPPATSRSCGRSSSPATRCSSTSCSCTRRARTRRCRTRASRSRAGSSAPRLPGRVRPARRLVRSCRPLPQRPRPLGRLAGAVGRAHAAVPRRRRRALGRRGRRVRRRPDARAGRLGGAARARAWRRSIPSPQDGLVALARERPELELIRETSLEALPRDPAARRGDHRRRPQLLHGQRGAAADRRARARAPSCRCCSSTTSAGRTAAATTTSRPS